MAEKHKSKYKKPENSKPTYRKDIKDYTLDNKDSMNPYSTGKKQEKVSRKIDKPVQDDGKMYPKYTDKDRLYKKIEDGEYDPKHAMNVLRKRQQEDSDEYLDKRNEIDHGVTTSELKERINRLSPIQKEQLVREYIRRKIAKVLKEQNDAPTDTPEETPAPDAAATPTPDAGATPEAGATPTPDAAPTPDAGATPAPTPDASATPAPDAAAAPTQGATPSPTTPTQGEETPEQDPEEQEKDAVKKITKALERERGNIGRIETIAQVLNKLFKDAELADTKNFYKLLNKLTVKKLSKIQAAAGNSEEKQK
jgi:hypothetical protein